MISFNAETNDTHFFNYLESMFKFIFYSVFFFSLAGRNIVVNKCMIHNDASCDITKDGDKLITLIPPDTPRDNQTFRFGIFSILKENLGERLCVWGYVSGPVSLSFSPLGNYVIMGSAPPEHWIDDDRTVIYFYGYFF